LPLLGWLLHITVDRSVGYSLRAVAGSNTALHNKF
jgi:hypothetical protein